MRTNSTGIDGRVTLGEIEDINYSSDESKDKEQIVDNVNGECSEVETFEEKRSASI